MNKEISKYKRYAFISYSHQDEKEAKWLHKHLESYKLPNDIYNEYDEKNRFLQPIFRDKDDIKTGILKTELYKELESSNFLIVICSLNSAHSSWVSQEVQTFIDLGRIDKIIPFIIDGVPNAGEEKECFPQSLLKHIKNHPNEEILGANIQEVGKEKALIRVVSSLLNVDFDTLWKRHERDLFRKKCYASFSVMLLLCAIYWLVVPISISLRINDDNHNLPISTDAKVIVNGTTYTLNTLDTTIIVPKIPGYLRLSQFNIKFTSTYYLPLSYNCKFGYGINNFSNIYLKRDNTFANFIGTVLDENRNPIDSALVVIEGRNQYTDSLGKFSISFPTIQQTTEKLINIQKNGFCSISRSEIPFNKATYYLFR